MRSFLFFLLCIVAGSLALPLVASAQGIPFFGPIVRSDFSACPAGWGALMVVINNIIRVLVSLAIVFVAPIMIAYAGFLFVVNPVNPSGIAKARGVLINTIVGLVIALAGWMIIAAIMAVLYNSSGSLGTWTNLISGSGDACLRVAGASYTSGTTGVVSPGVVTPSITGNEATVRNRLTANGISINKPPCPANTRYQDVSGGCTTVGGLNTNTVDQAINLKNKCGAVQITGGSELGHTDGGQSHTTGYKIDLATNVDGCITGGSGGYFSVAGTRGSYQRYTDRCGNEYVREPTHWDITVGAVCSL